MPLELTRVRIHCHDGVGVQIVQALRAAELFRPRFCVARSGVNCVRFGVIRHAIPNRTTAAPLPPFAAPGFRRGALRFVFEAFGGIARHGAEARDALARRDVVGVEEPANRMIAARHADDDFVTRYTRRDGKRVPVHWIRYTGFPFNLTRKPSSATKRPSLTGAKIIPFDIPMPRLTAPQHIILRIPV